MCRGNEREIACGNFLKCQAENAARSSFQASEQWYEHYVRLREVGDGIEMAATGAKRNRGNWPNRTGRFRVKNVEELRYNQCYQARSWDIRATEI
jgi:hypothetical protein